jgi:hypothetical protein
VNVSDMFQFMCKHLCNWLGLAPGFSGVNPNASARLTETTDGQENGWLSRCGWFFHVLI